jgi:hypothetical protein
MLRTITVALFLFFQAPGNPGQQPVKGSIQGVVLRSGTTEPVERARVTLQRIMPPPPPTAEQPTPPPQIPPVQTEADGKFIFKDLEPGQYRLRAQRNGFAPMEYGQRTLTSAGTAINLTEGQQLKDVAFRLIPAATVSGRMRDSKGEAVPGMPVSLSRVVYGPNGQRTLSNVGSASTDDRGDYRLFWVPPGRYLLSAGAPGGGNPFGVGARNAFVDRIFPVTYYPGVLDPSRAVVLDLQPGTELGAIDLVLTQPATQRIRGRVLEGATGKPAKAVQVWLGIEPESGAAGLLTTTWSTANINYSNVTGIFEISNVIPGSYLVGATGSSDVNPQVNLNFTGTTQAAFQMLNSMVAVPGLNSDYLPIGVANADVEGIQLTLLPGLTIPVRVRVEEQEVSSLSAFDRIRVNLQGISPISTSVSQAAPLTAEGTAAIHNVSPGEYRVQVTPLAPEFFIKEAVIERVDVLSRPWEINNRTSGTLNILLSNKSGRIEGRLSDAQLQPVRGNQVVLVPDAGRDRPDLYKIATTDQNGGFTFRGIVPGAYRLYAWELIEANSWFDKELLSQYQTQGKSIRVQESGHETVDLQIIPAPK